MDNNTTLQRQMLRTKGAIWNATSTSALILDGTDAAAFLHNLLTNDIKRLALHQGCWAIKATPKGLLEDLVFVCRSGEKRFLLINQQENSDALAEGIDKLHFSEDFKVHRVGNKLGFICISGPMLRQLVALASSSAVADGLASLKPNASSVEIFLGLETRIIRHDPLGDEGYLLALDGSKTDAFFCELSKLAERLGMVTLNNDAEALVLSRIEAGIPQLGVEIAVGELASSLGINHPAFNYDKGCYVGQEVIARIRTKGEVPQRLMGLHFPSALSAIPPGTKVSDREGEAAGEVLRSTTTSLLGGVVAIAKIKRSFQVVGLKLKAGNEEGEVCELPFTLPKQEVATSKLYEEAMTLFAQNREAEAKTLLEKELDGNPENADALEAIGVIYDRLGDHKSAIEAMQRIVAMDEKHLMANVNLSMYFMKVGDKATAEEWQAKATRISLERRMAEARAKGQQAGGDAEAEQVKKLEDRITKFKQIIEMDPGDVLGWFGAGKASLDLKRFGDAATFFEKAVEIQPDYSVAWSNLGAAYASLGEKEKAKTTLEHGIEVARAKGDMMPVRDMQARLERLGSA